MKKSFTKSVEWLSDKLNIIGAVCLVGMMLLTCADVVGRFFRHPIFGSVELVGFMATLAVALALPYTHQVKGHIGVELFVRTLPEKVRTIIALIISILSFLLVSIITWRMLLYAQTMQRSGEVSMNLELPTHAVIYLLSFYFLIFALVICMDIMYNFKKLKN